ncbi:MAG: 50S ribosomal protein L9 [Candidatus Spechtbacteria bacterium RIFCSPLOWO2_12_FULL_38_22]|uniref:Large ribosomal subunit protein bL9 n=1 Tax=Candidatus Spechtbacteria bacterium RIFCSPLOWO2_12_FULL_38_22 TaxID=1802165 RepID=A0A1G2HHK0_9BACT|nr:MAG: 50S ribosomal protein L9 [Candidatus Spechtbacteria bacterium RIFCSPHIGHO2_01_FULL_38_11]OGZ59470.1 MAG: 50S ribosomal protein L9 [Candidatus Spechtbacteria bacterium RIFCSPHIGHO2_12_FULL_38_30]OGZ59923.1 MAG: 50S ribosomal protein L9 [Candidatus Spechtbacteria bacterium RIFCSPLOWO2_01_FULL_38_20]OGZ61750.1 MAG: 50S ribosomal protein L9 [Candidatus Spechtbacteria bacterium RIFCSPLOWO2_12_FULL_38_22]
MRVVLLQDIKDLGKKGEVKNVSDGFARNFLIPKKLVVIASKSVLLDLEMKKKAKEQQAVQELESTESLVSVLDGYELILKEKADEGGKLYATLTPAKIAKALGEAGFKVLKGNVKIEGIKEIGEHNVTLEFDHNLEAEVKIILEKI